MKRPFRLEYRYVMRDGAWSRWKKLASYAYWENAREAQLEAQRQQEYLKEHDLNIFEHEYRLIEDAKC